MYRCTLTLKDQRTWIMNHALTFLVLHPSTSCLALNLPGNDILRLGLSLPTIRCFGYGGVSFIAKLFHHSLQGLRNGHNRTCRHLHRYLESLSTMCCTVARVRSCAILLGLKDKRTLCLASCFCSPWDVCSLLLGCTRLLDLSIASLSLLASMAQSDKSSITRETHSVQDDRMAW